MGIVSGDHDSDEWKAFINEVENVSFSDPELVSVNKVEENISVGELKEALNLDCQYSEQLTDSDIEEINSTELVPIDWVLISLKPFTSDEVLTVTLKDGQAFTVQVTDSQMALHINSYAVDTKGNQIQLSGSHTNSFTVYRKQGTESDPIDGQEVKDLNVGEYSEAAVYEGYSDFGDGASIEVGTHGTGMVYVYGATAGMYYIQEDIDSVPDTITDSEGHTWKYVGTRIETEYVWRSGKNDGTRHISDVYTKESEAFNSIPEVVGNYKNYDSAPEGHEWDWDNNGTWEALLNGFLDFYVYNIYEPQAGDLTIKKTVTVNGAETTTALADGAYTFELWNADGTEQITHAADGTAIGDLTITITNGQEGSRKIAGLNGGTYIVREVNSTNTAIKEMTDSEEGYNPALRGIVVTVTEDQSAEVTFINDYSAVNHTVKKIWEGDDLPSSLTVTLYGDELPTEHVVTLNSGNGWSATVGNLPKYNAAGKEIQYYWVEGDVPSGFFVTGYDVSSEGNTTITTITNTYRKYEFTTFYEGTKEWIDDSDLLGSRPEALHVTLYASYVTNPGADTPIYGEPEATFFEPVWTKNGDRWTFRFENIPVFDENGEVIIYTSSETAPAEYVKTENVTPTEYSLGTFVLESGNQRVTPNSTKTFNIESLLDLPVFGIKKGGTYIIWSPRTPTPREESQARQALAQRDSHFENARWYIDSQVIPTDSPNNTVYVTFDPEAENPYVALRFNASSAWSWFVYGKFNGGENKYQKGTAEFTNTLTYVTPELSGIKIWDIAGDNVPADPILKLTRTVTITPAEGDPYTTAPETVNATPTWSGDGKERIFVYHDLPAFDSDGNKYTYHVAETSFVVDGVTYTTVRHSDGTYTVTPSDESADTYVTIQVDEPIEGSDQLKAIITNAQSTDFSFNKIWYNNDNEVDIWPEGKSITVLFNAETDDGEKLYAEDVEVTLSPSHLPSNWDVSVNSSGTRATFSTSGLPTTKNGKALTYYVVENQVDGYQPPSYQNGEGSEITDKALNGGTITNIPVRVKIEITKIGDWDVKTLLSDVKFKLFSDEGCTTQLLVDSDGNPIGTDGVITTVDGKAPVGTFTPGKYYLKEVTPAAGYNMIVNAIPFTIKADGSVTYSTGNIIFDGNPGAWYLTDDGIGIYINNLSGAELPMTGGYGTLPYTLCGLMLMLGSALMYGFRMRRRERRYY